MESIEATTELQEVVDAFKVQVERDRERNISIYALLLQKPLSDVMVKEDKLLRIQSKGIDE